MEINEISEIIRKIALAGSIIYLTIVGVISIPTLYMIKNSVGYTRPIYIKYLTIFIGTIPIDIPIYMNSDYLTIGLLILYFIFGLIDIIRKVEGYRPLTKMFILGGLTFTISVLIQYIQNRFGVEVGELEAPNDYIYYISAVTAPLTEEIGFRLSIIGLASLIILLTLDMKKNLKNILTTLLNPYGLYGERKEVMRILYIFVTITAVIFGFAHLLGVGWKIGKVSLSIIAGLYLGYLYVKYGLTTSILGHAYFNIYLLTLYFLEQHIDKYIPSYSIYINTTVNIIYLTFSLGLGTLYMLWLIYYITRYKIFSRSGEGDEISISELPNMSSM